MAKLKLCKLKNNVEVYYDPALSHVATHFQDTSQLKNLVTKFLSKQEYTEPEIYLDYDTGRAVGTSDLVETDDSDQIIYAKRQNRDGFTRFVKNRQAEPTSYITVYLIKDREGKYELSSAWVGQTCPAFPDDAYAIPESRPFWTKHALVWGNQAIQAGTETEQAPW